MRSHAGNNAASHAGDGAAGVAWPRCDVDAESYWRQ
jgi:hypothetical protein